ncbi:MAG: protein kinase domain-containing protein, partial [Gemmataceae bacterium]
MTEERVFLAALDRADPAERRSFLDVTCGGDADLRRRVEQLLAAHFKPGAFLDEPLALEADAGEEDEGADDLTFLGPPTRPDSLGRIGHYEALQVLGRGGCGIVLRACDDVLQRVVAIKVLAPAMAAQSPPRKRFLREARASAGVRHENVVQVYAVEERPLPHLVMEYIPGETLQQRLDRCGPLDAAEAVRVGRQIAEGLAAAHGAGLVHRDIKPANVLIEAGPSCRVKITDFGLARAADDASLTQSGVVAGTPMYMSPEQATGEAIDHRADLFSLGSVLYTMCTGRPPFRGKNALAVLKRVVEDTPRPIREVIPEVPGWLCDLIARLQAKTPGDRYDSAKEVADLLGRGQADAPRPPAAAPAARRWAAAALLLVSGLGLAEASGVTRLSGTVIRLFSPEGTLVVEVDDPAVSVTVGGSELVITGAGPREIRLKTGRYAVEAVKGGKVLRRELVEVTKGGRRVVRVSQEAGPGAGSADRRAAEYVLSIGGTIEVDEGKRVAVAVELPAGPFRLTAVDAQDNRHVSDAGLAPFQGCEHLTTLVLYRTAVTDAGLAHFKGCKGLTTLHLMDTAVGDAGLANFEGCTRLTYLALLGTRVTDAGLAHFKGCKGLNCLQLIDTRVTDAGLAHFAGCARLERLELDRTRVTDAGLAHF